MLSVYKDDHIDWWIMKKACGLSAPGHTIIFYLHLQ